MGDELPRTKADPGWNDPPLFSYDTHQAHAQTSKKVNLTKRVAFPTSGVSTSQDVPKLSDKLPLPGGEPAPPLGTPPSKGTPPLSKNSSPGITSPPPAVPPILPRSLPPQAGPPPLSSSKLPPLSSPKPPSVNPTSAGCDNEQSAGDACEDFDIQIIMEKLDKVFIEIDSTESEKSSVVKKRFQLLENSWKDNKFNLNAKKKIHLLVEALENKESANCIELQRSLMVDYPSVCSPWMPGIRHIMSKLNLTSAHAESEAAPEIPEPSSAS